MADIVSPATRSRMMSGIRGSNTRMEVELRRLLHAGGFRFRLHDRKLPGRPDIVLPKHRAVILVNGCFWHGHDCHLMKWPSTRPEFWREKIGRNQERDVRVWRELEDAGWRVVVLWECAVRGPGSRSMESVAQEIAGWLPGDEPGFHLRGSGVIDSM